MNTLARDTAHGYFWNQLAVTLDGLTLLLSSIIVGRMLGAESLGLFGWILSAVGLLTITAGLGIKEAVNILLPPLSSDPSSSAGLFRLCLLVRSASAVLAGIVLTALLLFLKGNLTSTACAVSLYLVFSLTAGLLSAFNIALFQTRILALGRLLSSLLTLLLIALASASRSMPLVFASLALGSLSASAVFFLPLSRFTRGPSTPFPPRRLLSLGLALWLISILNYLLAAQAAPLILRFVRLSPSDIGLFTAAFVIAASANRALMSGFSNVTLASFSKAWSEAGDESLSPIYSLYIRVAAALGVPVLLGVIVFSPLLVRLPLKAGSPDASLACVVLASFFLVGRLFGGGAHSTALYASGLHLPGLAIRSAFAFLCVVSTALAALKYGILGASFASGASGAAVILAELFFLRRRRNLPMPWSSLIRLSSLCGAVALVSRLILSLGGLFSLLFSSLVFLCGSLLALSIARPLSHGETALLSLPPRLASLALIFERRRRDEC